MSQSTLIDLALCRELSLRAKENPRLRQNLNFHPDLESPSQRMLNALEPGTYIRPHRHLDPPRAETFIALRGRMALCLFSDQGVLQQVVAFGAGAEVYGADVPAGVWHSMVSLESGAVFFEAKDGPFRPLTGGDWPSWAPAEGTPEATVYLTQLQRLIQRQFEAKG